MSVNISICRLRQVFPIPSIIARIFTKTNFRQYSTNTKFYNQILGSTTMTGLLLPSNQLYQPLSWNLMGFKNLGTNSSITSWLHNRGRYATLKENTRLAEVITIYEKLTKSDEWEKKGGFCFSTGCQTCGNYVSKPQSGVLDDIKYVAGSTEESSPTVLDFSKFRDIRNQNYMYFSAKTGLIQANSLHTFRWKYSFDIAEKSCLCIVNPTEDDFAFLGTHLNVHDLTLRDIRERNTEEKVEVFNNYTFISFKVYLDAGENGTDPLSRGKKEDLSILMFPDSECAIILHYGDPWTEFKDMMGFLNLLCTYGDSSLTPDWVLFSIVIELAQVAKFDVKQLESKILNLKVGNSDSVQFLTDIDTSTTNLTQVLTKNFENEFEIYRINRFIKPKTRLLKELQVKANSRISPNVLNLLSNTSKEFEELGESLGHFNHILERSQDTCLTLANVRLSQEANEMGRMMKRVSEVALLFLPLQAIADLLGMKVKCPLQDWDSTLPFWGIIATSSCIVYVLHRINQAANKMPSTISRKPPNQSSQN